MNNIHKAIIVCALGYFIDVFDIQLFAVLRLESLSDLGVEDHLIQKTGGDILTIQCLGMVLGAFLWGWLGDRFGRLRALYGSIILYSLGTFACAFVQDPGVYAVLRFITGFGLAGETGAAITLIAESMQQKNRGWGITIVASFGFFGPACAVLVAGLFDWRTTYMIAGGLGLAILILRARLLEPRLFEKLAAHESVKRGDLRLLFSRERFSGMLYCFLLGLPSLYMFSILNFYSFEFAKDFVVSGAFDQKTALLCFYVGIGFGDIICGSLSQLWRSRKQAFLLFLTCGALLTLFYLAHGRYGGFSVTAFYAIYAGLGVIAGYWVLFSMVAAEHFGTNLRASAAIITVNLVRGVTVIIVPLFNQMTPLMGHAEAALAIALLLYIGAFWALGRVRETHHLDLDYVEEAIETPKAKKILKTVRNA